MTKYQDFDNFTEYDKYNLLETVVDNLAGIVQYAKGNNYDGKG